MSGAETQNGTPEAYLKFLKTSPEPSLTFTGMTKLSGDDGEILFAPQGDCSRWTAIGLAQIDAIEHVGWATCGAHRHPLARITMKPPQDDHSATFAKLATLHHDALTAQAITCPPGQRPCFDVGTGRWTCCPG